MNQKMRFFNIDEILSDDLIDQHEKYIRYVSEKIPCTKIIDFTMEVNLHDALLYNFNIKSGEIIINLVYGDEEVGYKNLSIKYTNATYSHDNSTEFIKETTKIVPEILYDEFDFDANSKFLHRIQFSSKIVLIISFDDFEYTINGPSNRSEYFKPSS